MVLKSFDKIMCECYQSNMINYRKYIALNEDQRLKISRTVADKKYIKIQKISENNESIKEIKKSKGDITKIKGYEDLKKCIEFLDGINKKVRDDDIAVIIEAYRNLLKNKEKFMLAFKFRVLLYEDYYAAIVINILLAICWIISNKFEAVATMTGEIKMAYFKNINGFGRGKLKYNGMIKGLRQFNELHNSGKFDIVLNHLTKKNEDFIGVVAVSAIVIAIIGIIIEIIRYSYYAFLKTSLKLSNFLKDLAEFLEANSKNLDPKKDEQKINKQVDIATNFRKVSDIIMNKIIIGDAQAEKEMEKEDKIIASTSPDEREVRAIDISTPENNHMIATADIM